MKVVVLFNRVTVKTASRPWDAWFPPPAGPEGTGAGAGVVSRVRSRGAAM